MNCIKLNSRGTEVATLQRLLGVTPADGIFGTKTQAALIAFQRSHGLTPDGICGPKTFAALQQTTPASTPATSTGNSSPLKGGGGGSLPIIFAPLTRKLTGHKRTKFEYLVIHYTCGSSSAPGRAKSTRDDWQKSNAEASCDYVVDDATMLQANPDPSRYYTWQVGDGHGKYKPDGETKAYNHNCIGIEMCSTLDREVLRTLARKEGLPTDEASMKKYYDVAIHHSNHTAWKITDATLHNAARLAAHLLVTNHMPLSRMVRHHDCSGKSCPGVIGWNTNRLSDPITGDYLSEKNHELNWLSFIELVKRYMEEK